MKAVLMSGFGDVGVLKIGEIPKPSAKENQVLVKVMATSINRPDLVQRLGHYPPPPGESEILGLEIAGIIEELGSGVTEWAVGDRVMTLVGGGGYAEYAVAYTPHLIPIPSTISFTEAACICETYITAFLNLFLLGQLASGETVLLHGGGGGVNTAGIQLCRALAPGGKIIVTTAPEKMERVRAMGADLVINFREHPDFTDLILDFTAHKGVDVILDHVGAAYFGPNMNVLAVKGRLICIGIISGPIAQVNIGSLMLKRQRIIGSVLRSRPVAEKGVIVAEFTRQVLPLFADRTIIPRIEKVFPLDDVVAAHRMMEEDRHFGKIVLEVDRQGGLP